MPKTSVKEIASKVDINLLLAKKPAQVETVAPKPEPPEAIVEEVEAEVAAPEPVVETVAEMEPAKRTRKKKEQVVEPVPNEPAVSDDIAMFITCFETAVKVQRESLQKLGESINNLTATIQHLVPGENTVVQKELKIEPVAPVEKITYEMIVAECERIRKSDPTFFKQKLAEVLRAVGAENFKTLPEEKYVEAIRILRDVK